MLKARVLAVAITAAALGTSLHAAENWARFRGPNGTGVSSAKNLPVEFGPANHVKWKTALPPGHSSPVFTNSHIFLTAHSAEKDAYKLFVLALDRKTGKQLWQHEIPRRQVGRRENVNGPASPSPVTDGANVYFFFQDFGLISYTADGKERWRMPLGPFNMFYGFGASPILEDGKLILAVDQDTDPYLLAVDAKSGKQLWRVSRPHVISGYSTPTIWRPKTGPAQILIPESFQLTAYSIADGKQLWWVRGLACEMKSVASIDDDTLYVNGWGFGQNQAGTQIPTVDFAEGLKRFDTNGDGFVGRDETARDSKERMDRMLRPEAGFDAFDGNRDGKLDAKDWQVFRAMLAAENGLMAITLGGSGRHDQHRGEVEIPAAGAAGAVDGAVSGRALHGERQRHPDLVQPRHRRRDQAGPPQGRHRQVFRVADRRRRESVAGQPGRHRLGGHCQRRLGSATSEYPGR